MNWRVDYRAKGYRLDALKSLNLNGFVVLENFFSHKEIEKFRAIGERLKECNRVPELIGYIYAIAERNELQNLLDLYFEEDCCFSGNLVTKYSSPEVGIESISNHELQKVQTFYTQGARRGLHHDLHGMGRGPLSFGNDETLYKLNQSNQKYGVVRAWTFLTDHNERSGTIQFLQKEAGKEYYTGIRKYSNPSNIDNIEQYLVNPNIENTSILLFNKATIHSARALRRIPEQPSSIDERGLHPLHELKSIHFKSGSCAYPNSRNFVTWDYVKKNNHGEKLIVNTVLMYILVPFSQFWRSSNRKEDKNILSKLSGKVYDITPLLVTCETYALKRLRLDSVICASVLYSVTHKFLGSEENNIIHIAINNCNLLIANRFILNKFTNYCNYKAVIIKLASAYLNNEKSETENLLTNLSTAIAMLVNKHTKEMGRTSVLYNDNQYNMLSMDKSKLCAPERSPSANSGRHRR